ncbi:Cytochrome P450 86B1 [Phytophthora citrophthora]|uniref:Cytochrome P450 86B1 n=1 Tax=Phytophthora citrophthora TaxID=4793 RepID=A0AAD9LQF3_9STRA|nr:Cytochrome P450 86B1 [Phytophthora citrophthora]
MLSISSLREKFPFHPVHAGIGGLILISAVALLAKVHYEPTDEDSTKPKIHRPDSTLPLLENTLDFIRAARDGDIHDRTAEVCNQFDGEPILFRSIGMPDQLVVASPEAFEEVLKIQFSNFPKGSYMCGNLEDLLGKGIFAADGGQWVHQRKTASNLFTMRSLRDSMTATIQRHAVVLYSILQQASDSGDTLDLFKLLNRFTFEAFAEIGFGVHMGCLASEDDHPFQKAFDHAQRALLLRFVRPSWFWKVQRWLNVGVEGKLKQDIEVINATVLDIVEKALSKRNDTSSDEHSQGKDIVSLFLDSLDDSPNADTQQFDPMYLRDIVVNFLIAGRDTTAQTLSWFFLNLTKNPQVETAIRNEIVEKLSNEGDDVVANATMKDVSQLTYLEAALKETLRLHPPVPMSPKFVMEDTTLADGTSVKGNSMIVLATYAMARMQNVWGEDAAEFKPERWIDATSGKLINVSPFKFASFNAGPRLCLGMNLAMLEMKLVVAGLLKEFHVEVQDPEEVTYDISLTLPVKGALNARIMPASVLMSPDFA